MAVSNLIRNRKRFMSECLDEEGGEFVMNGQADGCVRVFDDYDAFRSDPDAKRPKEYKMSIFPTNRRIVAYAARGGFFKDQFVYIPIQALRAITFNRGSDGKNDYCVTEFISKRNSGFPSFVFKLDVTGHSSDLDQYMLILLGFSKLAGIKITDYTAPTRVEKKQTAATVKSQNAQRSPEGRKRSRPVAKNPGSEEAVAQLEFVDPVPSKKPAARRDEAQRRRPDGSTPAVIRPDIVQQSSIEDDKPRRTRK